jgi:CDP-glycerol glycerophosphotransferase (TagB/SpsB family)
MKMRFLIYISQPYSIPIGKPLQTEIEKRGYSVKWFCDEKETYNALTADEPSLYTVEEVKAYAPHVVLVATNTVPDFFSGIKVQIFHGFSVGKRKESRGHFSIRGFFDLYCTQGPSTTEPFKELQKKHRYFQVVETGWSKMDPLFPLESVAHEKPTILVSSTFTERLSLAKNEEAVLEIERLSKLGKWKFMAILHPKMDAKTVSHFEEMQHKDFTFYNTTNLIPLFKQADVMLSDTTSAITEFALQKKPVVTLNNNKPEAYMLNVHHASEIEAALQKALSQPKEVMEALEDFIEKTHPYTDGDSSARVIDACMAFLKEGKQKRKPLNLLRRYKIRRQLHYWGL